MVLSSSDSEDSARIKKNKEKNKTTKNDPEPGRAAAEGPQDLREERKTGDTVEQSDRSSETDRDLPSTSGIMYRPCDTIKQTLAMLNDRLRLPRREDTETSTEDTDNEPASAPEDQREKPTPLEERKALQRAAKRTRTSGTPEEARDGDADSSVIEISSSSASEHNADE